MTKEMKQCKGGQISCGEWKALSEFELRSDTEKYRGQCIECRTLQHRQSDRNWYLSHKEERAIYKKKYDQENQQQNKQYRVGRKKKKQEYDKEYGVINRDKLNAQNRVSKKRKRKIDPVFRFKEVISRGANRQLRAATSSKQGKSSQNYLPQSPEEGWAQIEALLSLPSNLTPEGKVWMTVNNWGVYDEKTWIDDDYSTHTWNIDHIEPQSHLPYDNMECENYRKCWNKDNLRPLSAKQNIQENDNRTPEQISAIKEEIRQFLKQRKK
jgi:hypothetical protein